MKVIKLSATAWSSPEDFYCALLPELGAPSWHGRNLDALYDSLSGGINRVEPPFLIELEDTGRLPPDMADFLAKLADVFKEAREEFGADVSIVFR